MLKRINTCILAGTTARKLFFFFGILSLLVSCAEDEFSYQEQKRQTLMLDELKKDTSVSIAIEALDRAKMSPLLNTYGPYTFFVPDNNAFRKYFQKKGKKSIEDFTVEEVKALMVFHILPTRLKSGQFIQGPQTVTTGNKDYITLDISKGYKSNSLANAQARVYETDIEFSNGFVHKLDGVLDPPINTIGQFLLQNEDKFSILIGGLKRAGLMDTLVNLDNERKERIRLTLFAETNDVLQKSGITSYEDMPIEDLVREMRYHIVAGSGFSSSYTPTTAGVPHLFLPARFDDIRVTLNGNWIYFNLDAPHLVNSTVDFTSTDVIMRNGVLHTVNAPLVFGPKTSKRVPIHHLFKDEKNYGYGIPQTASDGILAVFQSAGNWRISDDGNDIPDPATKSVTRTGIRLLFAAWDNEGDSVVSVVRNVRKGKYRLIIHYKLGDRGTVQFMYREDKIGTPVLMNTPGVPTPVATYRNKVIGDYTFETSGDKRIKMVAVKDAGGNIKNVAWESLIMLPLYD